MFSNENDTHFEEPDKIDLMLQEAENAGRIGYDSYSIQVDRHSEDFQQSQSEPNLKFEALRLDADGFDLRIARKGDRIKMEYGNPKNGIDYVIFQIVEPSKQSQFNLRDFSSVVVSYVDGSVSKLEDIGREYTVRGSLIGGSSLVLHTIVPGTDLEIATTGVSGDRATVHLHSVQNVSLLAPANDSQEYTIIDGDGINDRLELDTKQPDFEDVSTFFNQLESLLPVKEDSEFNLKLQSVAREAGFLLEPIYGYTYATDAKTRVLTGVNFTDLVTKSMFEVRNHQNPIAGKVVESFLVQVWSEADLKKYTRWNMHLKGWTYFLTSIPQSNAITVRFDESEFPNLKVMSPALVITDDNYDFSIYDSEQTQYQVQQLTDALRAEVHIETRDEHVHLTTPTEHREVPASLLVSDFPAAAKRLNQWLAKVIVDKSLISSSEDIQRKTTLESGLTTANRFESLRKKVGSVFSRWRRSKGK